MKKIFLSMFVLSQVILVNAQKLEVEQVQDKTYQVKVAEVNGKSKVVWNGKPDTWNNAQPVALSPTQETVVLASAHPILKLESGKAKVYAAPRGVKMEGANNFRDIGGYYTTDKRQVKWGKIYRSADISKLTDADLQVIRELNIKMVCDLRGEAENETAPDRLPEGVQHILLSAGSENVGGANSMNKYFRSPEKADSFLISFYKRTDHLGKKYKPMFDELLKLEPDHALMFHCSAGKDRTGIGAALILHALGVDRETIMADYVATNEFRKAFNAQHIQALVERGMSEDAAKKLMAAKPEYLQAAFDAIEAQYGSLDKFLETEIGLTSAKRNTLKSKFLY